MPKGANRDVGASRRTLLPFSKDCHTAHDAHSDLIFHTYIENLGMAGHVVMTVVVVVAQPCAHLILAHEDHDVANGTYRNGGHTVVSPSPPASFKGSYIDYNQGTTTALAPGNIETPSEM